MLRHPALAAINAYQRHLSPREGYGCVDRLAHGETGCPGFAKDTSRSPISDTVTGEATTSRQKKTRWYDFCDPCGGCYCPRMKSSPADTPADCTPNCTPDCCSFEYRPLKGHIQ